MIKDNVLHFGYGSIVTISDIFSRKIMFNHIDPAQPIGPMVSEEIEVINSVVFEYGEDMNAFFNLLKDITTDFSIITFRDYDFDFTNFNEKSLHIVQRGFMNIISAHTKLLAV